MQQSEIEAAAVKILEEAQANIEEARQYLWNKKPQSSDGWSAYEVQCDKLDKLTDRMIQEVAVIRNIMFDEPVTDYPDPRGPTTRCRTLHSTADAPGQNGGALPGCGYHN